MTQSLFFGVEADLWYSYSTCVAVDTFTDDCVSQCERVCEIPGGWSPGGTPLHNGAGTCVHDAPCYSAGCEGGIVRTDDAFAGCAQAQGLCDTCYKGAVCKGEPHISIFKQS